MTMTSREYRGIVKGKVIELADDPQLPHGQAVTVELHIGAEEETRASLRRAFGSWRDMPGFEEWIAETYQARLAERPSAMREHEQGRLVIRPAVYSRRAHGGCG